MRTGQRINELENGPSSYRQKNNCNKFSRGFLRSDNFGARKLGP